MNKKNFFYLFIVCLFVLFGLVIYSFNQENPTGLVATGEKIDEPLFQISLEIPSEYKKINVGESLLTYLEVKNIGVGGRVDVLLEYQIFDSEDNQIFFRSETVAVETDNSFVRYLDIPRDMPSGRYNAQVVLTYSNDRKAMSSSSFRIG